MAQVPHDKTTIGEASAMFDQSHTISRAASTLESKRRYKAVRSRFCVGHSGVEDVLIRQRTCADDAGRPTRDQT